MTKNKIEWNIDMDKISETWSFGGGEAQKADFKGRCKKCWGGLIGRTNEAHVFTGIKCRVCGEKLEGKDAEQEEKRISQEGSFNALNMHWGNKPKYGNGMFVNKVFPHIERQMENEIRERVRTKATEGRKKYRLTRSSFPPGSPGYFLMQAKILMAGLEDMANPNEWSIYDNSDVEVRDDGSLVVPFSIEGLNEDPRYFEYQLEKKLGSIMTEALISAFACELAMKAICLTCKDESIKSHDLLELYNDLPEESRSRIEFDYPEIAKVMEKGRQTFGKWRYFEQNVSKVGMRAMIDLPQARALGKAARVMLDEAQWVGLQAEIEVNVNSNVRIIGEKRVEKQTIKVNLIGREAPPKLRI